MNYQDFFEQRADVSGGQVVLRGTRVPLRTILASLAEGDNFDDLVEAFPSLTPEQYRAVVAFAASSALEDQPVPSVPQIS